MKFGPVYLDPGGEEPNTSAKLQNVTEQRLLDRKCVGYDRFANSGEAGCRCRQAKRRNNGDS